MKQLCLSFAIIILYIQNAIANQNELNPNIKNESTLQYSITDKEVVGATSCNGFIDSLNMAKLLEIGISKQDLMKSVNSTVGDFDGNGYLDFAIWGSKKDKKYQPDYTNYIVLFFEKDRIIRAISIKSDFPGELLVHYPPRSKIGPNGEPISVNDALWLIGQTGDYDDTSKGIVYIFDTKLGNFKKIKFGYKN